MNSKPCLIDKTKLSEHNGRTPRCRLNLRTFTRAISIHTLTLHLQLTSNISLRILLGLVPFYLKQNWAIRLMMLLQWMKCKRFWINKLTPQPIWFLMISHSIWTAQLVLYHKHPITLISFSLSSFLVVNLFVIIKLHIPELFKNIWTKWKKKTREILKIRN